MTLTIPTLESSPTFDGQTVIDGTDIAALVAAESATGVLTGCGVTAQSSPNMTVQVAAGNVVINGVTVPVTAVSSLTIGAASTYDRRDIVVVNSSGTVSITAGTPCATAAWSRTVNALPPVKPAIPSNSTILAEIYVAASTTSIATTNIVDKTCILVIVNGINRTATATVAPWEITVFTGSTASQTLTFPSAPKQGTTNTVVNYSSVNVTVAAGSGDTIDVNGTTGSNVQNPSEVYQFVYVGTTWYLMDSNDLTSFPVAGGSAGQRVVVNPAATSMRFQTAIPGTPDSSQASMTASTQDVVAGTKVQLATSDLAVGTTFRFMLAITKTAAGTATWTIKVCFGTAGTNADTAIATFTSGTNTAIEDRATVEILVRITGTGSGGTAVCTAYYVNQATDSTGLGDISFAPGTTAAINTTLTSPYIHCDITPGASAVMTCGGYCERVA